MIGRPTPGMFAGSTLDIRSGRTKLRSGLFYQWREIKAGDTFEHLGQEFTVDNVVASPSGGFEVSAHPSAVVEDPRCA